MRREAARSAAVARPEWRYEKSTLGTATIRPSISCSTILIGGRHCFVFVSNDLPDLPPPPARRARDAAPSGEGASTASPSSESSSSTFRRRHQ